MDKLENSECTSIQARDASANGGKLILQGGRTGAGELRTISEPT